MRTVILAAEDDLQSWRAAVRGLAAARVPADQVTWRIGNGPADLFAGETVIPDLDAAPLLVPRYFANLANCAILHRDPERFSLLYALLLRLLDNPNLLKDRADRQLRRVEDLFHAIRRDMHKMRAFVRFREFRVDSERRFVAWFEPEHHIVRANAKFFVDRFTGMAWSILTPQVCIHWDGTTLTEGPGATRGEAPVGDPVEAVWKRYFASIFNPARLNPDAMMKEMPKKYWKNLPEAVLVPELIASARAREVDMLDRMSGGTRRAATAPVAIAGLRQEAAGCRRCLLWQSATQTVFGEGPADARIMVVGEQPGDQEDLAGRAFVGPAGQVLDRALAAAGIDRGELYLTNTVKHFRFEQRGKRRIHATPRGTEVEACRWWLDQERAIIRPKLVIALGTTAARAILGRPIVMGQERGILLPLPDGNGACLITVHPSYILRLPDRAEAEAEFTRFVTDLTQAHIPATRLARGVAGMRGLEIVGLEPDVGPLT